MRIKAQVTRHGFQWLAVLAAVLAAGCSSTPSNSSGASSPAAPAAGSAGSSKVASDPHVIEQTDAYYISRFRKNELIRIDDTHVRFPISRMPMVIYREDADYYYIRTEKYTPEEKALARQKEQEAKHQESIRAATVNGKAVNYDRRDFESIVAAVGAKAIRLDRAGAGLPTKGQYRDNIAVADINGDGIPDIVSTIPRQQGGHGFKLFLGDGAGNFKESPVKIVDAAGKPAEMQASYGGATVADLDGDGKPDIATVSHSGGIHVFLQRENLTFQLDDKGLPGRQFSGQALSAIDADGDGHPDLVVSQDQAVMPTAKDFDHHQVRIFLNQGADGWKESADAVVDGFYSNKVSSFSPDGDGSVGFATGTNFYYGINLIWKRTGPGHFEKETLDEIEPYAYHFGIATGHFGMSALPAVAGFFVKEAPKLKIQSAGINVYVHEGDAWKKHIVFRELGFNASPFLGIAMGDLDGDGLDDVVFPDLLAHRLRVFFQTAAGGFEEMKADLEPELESPVADIRLADLRRSGKLDIILAQTVYSGGPKETGGLAVYLNGGPAVAR